MLRTLPYSLALHVAMLAAVVLVGTHISQPPLDPRQVIQVRLAELPKTQPPPRETPATPEPDPVVEQPESPPPEPPKVEPKQLPEEPPEERKPPTEPEREEPVVERLEPQVEQLAPLPGQEPDETAVAGTDKPFPFTYYLNRIEARISAAWNPRQLGFREGSQRSCVVHFFIERGGAVSRATIARPSGVALFDREALRAVQAAHPLPPLPAEFTARNLGVTFIFTLESGI